MVYLKLEYGWMVNLAKISTLFLFEAVFMPIPIGFSQVPKSFSHINPSLLDSETSELKVLYQYCHTKYWLFKMTYKYFKKRELELGCNIIGSVSLVISGSIAGGITLNPIILGFDIRRWHTFKNIFRNQELQKESSNVYICLHNV